MAIAVGAALGQVQGNDTTFSIGSLSISGSNLIMIVAIGNESNGVSVSTLKWDDGAGGSEQSFTQLGSYQEPAPGDHRFSLWYLLGPSTSNSRIIETNNLGVVYMAAAYYSGVKQTSTFTTPVQGASASSPLTATNTSAADGSWAIGGLMSISAGLAITSGTKRQKLNTADSFGMICDSNTGVNNISTFDFTWTGGDGKGYVTAMMAPVASAPAASSSGSGSLLMMGVGN